MERVLVVLGVQCSKIRLRREGRLGEINVRRAENMRNTIFRAKIRAILTHRPACKCLSRNDSRGSAGANRGRIRA